MTRCVENFAGETRGKQQPSTWLTWSEMPDLPTGVAGAFVGSAEGRLVVAGGSDFPVPRENGGEKNYESMIYVLERDGWKEAGSLPRPSAHGATVPHEKGILCIGGENTGGLSDSIFLLRYRSETKNVEVDANFITLPEARSYFGAAVHGKRLYVAGGKNAAGQATTTFWSIPLEDLRRPGATWRNEPAWPGSARFGASLLKQNAGNRDFLYFVGGKSDDGVYLAECFAFDPYDKSDSPWKRRAEMPRAALSAASIPRGQSHLLVFGGSDGESSAWLEKTGGLSAFPQDALAYHTITDTWCVCAAMPVGVACTTAVAWEKGIVLPGGELRPTVRTVKTQRADFIPQRTNFATSDYCTLFGYFLALGFLGYFLASWKKTSGDFLIGKRRIPWWAAALSLLATQVSSIGVMSIPAKSYATDWSYFVITGVWFLVVPIVTAFFIPFFRSIRITSAYEYLEYRFHWTIRLLAMAIYSLLQLGRMAIVLYLPSLALVAVTGIDPKISILLMGVFCTIYTFMGGLEAVIWIDVFQAILLIGGILLCVTTVFLGIDGGLPAFFDIAWNDGKFALGTLSFDWTIACVWVLLVGNFFTRLGGLISDQAIVQRYLTTPSDEAARRSLWGDVFLSLPWAVLVFSFGTALYVFFKTNPIALNPSLDTDGIVPYYIAVELTTPGLAGLIIAAIFAAAMSTFDGSIHSVATIWVVDVYARFFPKSGDASRLWLARFFTLSLGIFGTVAALVLTMFDIRSLWDSFFAITGLFIGGLTGLFLLAMFTRRTGSVGAMAGALGSAAVLWWVIHFTAIHFFLYSAIGCLTCVGIGYLSGFVFPGRPGAVEYTVFRRPTSGENS